MTAEAPDLDRIRVRFATFRDLSIADRARLARTYAGIPSDERVLVETCHRVELVTVDDGDDASASIGRDAVRRVFEVVAGFDSAVLAEEQLLGQARGAYEASLADGSTGPILNELFRRALRFGRRVRTHATPGTDRSLADRASGWLLERLSAPSEVLVAGTGEMGRLTAARVAGGGHCVTILSRSSERGGRMLEGLPGDGHRLVVGALSPSVVAGHAALVLAVRTREPMLRPAHLADGHAPWTVDLSTPAAVADDAAERLGELLLTLDELGRVAGTTPVLAPRVERRLRAELGDEVEGFVDWLVMRRSRDALATLHAEADAVRRRHLDGLRRRGRLTSEQLVAIEAASAAMMGELLHRPTVALRRGGADADTVRRLFGLES